MTSHSDKCETFATLHRREGAFLIPNPFDIGSARAFAERFELDVDWDRVVNRRCNQSPRTVSAQLAHLAVHRARPGGG